MWLAGAPGSGKGVITPLIQEIKGITVPPIEVSQLLSSPEAKAMKDSGKLVSDKMVLELLLEQLRQVPRSVLL